MARHQFKKGEPAPAGAGRPKGAVNQTTRDVREAIARLLEANVENMTEWLTQVAEGDEQKKVQADPAKALDIMHKMAEYHIPKLARSETTVNGGLTVNIGSQDSGLG